MKPSKYMSQASYEATAEFIKQAAAHEAAPMRAPKPDLKLLLVEPTHGPITSVELSGSEEHPDIAVRIHGRNPRYFDPLDHAAITLATAFSMPLRIHDTGGQMGYPRHKVKKPRGRNIYTLRILTDAQPWENARQRSEEGRYADYHYLHRAGLSKDSVRRTWEEGKKSRVPQLGRAEFYEAIALYWTDNHLKAGIPVSLEDHLDSIKTALEIGDRMQHKADKT